jgi:hypothetical protein
MRKERKTLFKSTDDKRTAVRNVLQSNKISLFRECFDHPSLFLFEDIQYPEKTSNCAKEVFKFTYNQKSISEAEKRRSGLFQLSKI